MRTLPRLLLALTLCLLPSHALVIVGETAANASSNALAPNFNHVGVRGDSSAVYLGNGWAITAAHVGAGNLTLGSTTYNFVDGSAVQLRNANDSFTDLVMFRIDGSPDLPSLTISSTSPGLNSAVTMIGNGLLGTGTTNRWQVTSVPGENNDEWVQNSIGNVRGISVGGTQGLRWGRSSVASVSSQTTIDGVSVTAFTTSFGTAANQAHAARYDSGGAIFTTSGQLAGIMLAIGTTPYDNPPAGWAFQDGVSRTFSADLSAYSDQIESIRATPVPEPALPLLASLSLLPLTLRRRRR